MNQTKIGAFAQRLLKAHADHCFATSSTESAKANVMRLLDEDINSLLNGNADSVDLKPWRSRQGPLKGRKTPYVQTSQADGVTMIDGIYRPGNGIFLTCESLDIDADALPLALYTSLQGKLEAMNDAGVFASEKRPRLKQLIDLSIPDYDPVVTGYLARNLFGSDEISIRTDQPSMDWYEFRLELEQIIETRQGRDYD